MKYVLELPHGDLKAKSFRELKAKIVAERDFWDEIGKFTRGDFSTPHLGSFLNPFISNVNELLSYWDRRLGYIESQDGRKISDWLPEFSNPINLSAESPPYSCSQVAQFIKKAANDNDRDLAFALLLSSSSSWNGFNRAINQNQQAAFGAFGGLVNSLHALDTLLEPKSLSKAVEADLSRSISVSEEMLETLALKITDLDQEKSSIEAKLESDRARVKKDVDEVLSNTTKSITKVLGHAISAENERANQEQIRKDKFDALLETFESRLRFQRPVDLWKERKEEHEINSKSARKIFLWGAGLFGISSILFATLGGGWLASTFISDGCVIGNESFCQRISPKGPIVVSSLLAVSTVWLWFLRLQMRLFLSERHLALDARERMAFAETYLSLLKGESVSRDHEAVILQSLFRPTQDGIIKDETGPDISIASLLARTLDKR